jgi:hypothetical protein
MARKVQKAMKHDTDGILQAGCSMGAISRIIDLHMMNTTWARRHALAFLASFALLALLPLTRALAADATQIEAVAAPVNEPAKAPANVPALPVATAPRLSTEVIERAGRDVAGVHFDATHVQDGQRLVLNGAGVRAKMIIKVYAMGLYLPQPEPDAQALLRSDVPHHIALLLLRDVDAERMRDGFGHAMLEHLPASQADAVRERVMALSKALMQHGDAHRGDTLALDYRPDVGTRVTLAGQAVCPDIPGADFNVAMLAMWLGPDAADGRLKAALLGAQP